MNLNGISKKLQRAIIQTGLIVKVGTTQFYSNEQKRLINVYILSTPVYQPNRKGEWKDRDMDILRTSSQIDVVNCLNDIWKAVK